MRKFISLGFVLLLAASSAQAIRVEQDPDYTNYDGLLRSYVSAEGWVDYQGLQANSAKDLQDVLNQLAQADLRGMDYREKLAFWINAYNANALQQILNHPGLNKVDEHLEIFDAPLPVAKGNYSLNDIEHRIIRGKSNPKTGQGPIAGVTLEIFDPRIHFALVCGAVGCPPLKNFAYTSKNIEMTLRQDSTDFANSKKYLRIEDGHLLISSLMKWYAGDFDTWGGPAACLTRLVDPTLRPDADPVKKKLITEYPKAVFTYDWTVNDIRHAKTQRPRLLSAPK